MLIRQVTYLVQIIMRIGKKDEDGQILDYVVRVFVEVVSHVAMKRMIEIVVHSQTRVISLEELNVEI